MECNSKEKLIYLMNFMYNNVYELIEQVLCDDEKDPHYSAVTAQNLVICYIDVLTECEIPLPFNSVAGFFSYCGFSQRDYDEFEVKRRKESVYYIGKQYQ